MRLNFHAKRACQRNMDSNYGNANGWTQKYHCERL